MEQLSSDAGTKLLRALGVKGNDADLRDASEEFGGHCLALTLLGSYLSDAYNGDVRCRNEVSGRLTGDVRQGIHAHKAMESYQAWFGEGPQLAVLRILGLFDRPADEATLKALLKPPAIRGLTESLIELSATEWQTVLGKLRRARLLAREDPHHLGQLDAHPLVREYFGGQLRSERIDAWEQSNRRLYEYYRMLAPELPETLQEMEPLFLAVICGCNAGLYREALHEIYIPRIQRGDAAFASKVLGAHGALLAMLAHFFEQKRWGSMAKKIVEGEKLSAGDQVFVLMQAASFLTATRDWSAEARNCWEQMESLCRSLNRPRLLYVALTGQWLISGNTDPLSRTMEIAHRVNSLAQKEGDPALIMGAYRTLADVLYSSGNFERARDYAIRALQIWRSGVRSPVEEVDLPVVTSLITIALCEWHFGEMDRSMAASAEAISLARDRNDMWPLALALFTAGILARFENNFSEVESSASELVELSTRCNFATTMTLGSAHLAWARAVSGDVPKGLSRIEEAIQDYRERGSLLGVPYLLVLKAEILHLANRTSEALKAIDEAEAISNRSEIRSWSSELHRLRGVFLASMHADENQVKDSLAKAINIAREQKSISLQKRAEAACAEYLSRKTKRSGARGLD